MMMTDARAAYLDASVATADPARLLVMLCDRLVLDVQRALARRSPATTRRRTTSCCTPRTSSPSCAVSLRPRRLGGRRRLAALYDYLHQQLVRANIHRDSR